MSGIVDKYIFLDTKQAEVHVPATPSVEVMFAGKENIAEITVHVYKLVSEQPNENGKYVYKYSGTRNEKIGG